MNEPGTTEPAWAGEPAAESAELRGLREQIDAVDRALLAELNRRAVLVEGVGRLKAGRRDVVYRAGRERDLVEALVRANPGPFPSAALPAVYREILSAMRSLEAKLRIAYLGPAGTSSHVAAREAFGQQVELLPVVTLADVIGAVERGQADHALLPIENTSEGVVTQALDALLACEVPLAGESWLRISYQLVAKTERTGELRRVASHPQALAQCRGWLDRNLPGLERVETSSTAAAAELAERQPATAAIVNPFLAAESGLAVLAPAIEDRRDNTTRFLVLGGAPPPPSGNDLTMLAYTVRKAESGALHRLLEPFSRLGVNLTSIQARPLKGAPWEYVFFLDLEGHRSEARVRQAVEEAGRVANSFRVLGSFPRAREAATAAEQPIKKCGAARRGRAMSLPVKPWVGRLDPYVPGKPIEALERELGVANAVKLASNENPLGPSPRAVEAIWSMAERVHRYPDGSCFQLRQALAARLDVAPDQLVFGTGSSEILELLAKCFLGPSDEVVYAWPSFAMYPIVVQGMGASSVRVPLDGDLVHDLVAMREAVTSRTRLVILCNPNNPTGTSVGAAAFDRFVASLRADVVLAVDEAYVEYARRPDFPDSLGWVRRRPGTCVLRTFSKIYGLAGLRMGYGVADRELAGYLQRARHPFNVNLIAEAAALAALDDHEHVERTRQANAAGFEFLTRELRRLGLESWPSDANFLLARAPAGTYERLLREGVIVRPMAGFGLPDHVRITIGTAEENERLVKALERLSGAVS